MARGKYTSTDESPDAMGLLSMADGISQETMMGDWKTPQWLIAVACLPLCGCIGGNILSYTGYDESSDSFALLELYVNIRTEKEAELDHLAELYARRDRLVLNFVPEFRLFSSPTILERHGQHTYSTVPVATTMRGEPDRLTTAVDLDTIKIVPGQFFLNEHGALCYYHQAVIPGKAIDEAMRERVPQIAAQLATLVREQRRLAARPGSRKLTWDEVRNALREGLDHNGAEREEQQHGRRGLLPFDIASSCLVAVTAEGLPVSDDGHSNALSLLIPLPLEKRFRMPNADEDQENGQELYPLDSTSLRLLALAGADNLVQFTRKADAFSLLVPLSERDCVEAVATVELARSLISDRIAAGTPVEELWAELLEAIEVRHVEGSGLQLTIKGAKFWKVAARRQVSMPKPVLKSEAAYRTTVAAIRERGIAVDETDLFPTILRQFFEAAREP